MNIGDAARLLNTAFERAAERLVKALDAGEVTPIVWQVRNQPKVHTYAISWRTSPALQELWPAVEEMSVWTANNWFSDIFQDAAQRQLQGCCTGNEPEDCFVFSLDYGEAWKAVVHDDT